MRDETAMAVRVLLSALLVFSAAPTACTSEECNLDAECPGDGCHPGRCAAGRCTTRVASDGSPCKAACLADGSTCSAGICVGSPRCVDADVCHLASCAADVCAQTVRTDVECDDGDPCTIFEVCASDGSCVGFENSCNDLQPCTLDTCTATGCVSTPFQCDDGDPCTVDQCMDNGSCDARPVDCDDGDVCSEDSCNLAGECTSTALADGSACGDGCSCVYGLATTAGAFASSCANDKECDSGYCRDMAGTLRCSKPCIESCPPPWTCKAQQNRDGDDPWSLCLLP